MQFVATVPRALEDTLASELRDLGATNLRVLRGAVAFSGDLRCAYRTCLWSRTASRVLLQLHSFTAEDGDALYEAVRQVSWLDHLGVDTTLAVDVDGHTSTTVDNTHYAALRIKDAIVDELRGQTGRRPMVDTTRASVRVHAYLRGSTVQLSIEVSAGGLHRRGYRPTAAVAPLKENLAAGLLLLANWPSIWSQGGPFVDPMCGSGTLLVEAALIAADVAPGSLRRPQIRGGWRGHQADVWRSLLDEARDRDLRTSLEGRSAPCIIGYDADPSAVRLAQEAIKRVGLQRLITVERRPVQTIDRPIDLGTRGLVVVNPPYGERIGEIAALKGLYAQLGRALKRGFPGWTACLLSGNAELSRCIGLRSARGRTVFNGPIKCRLLWYPLADVDPGSAVDAKPTNRERGVSSEATSTTHPSKSAIEGPPLSEMLRMAQSDGAETFANRLEKNAKRLGRWARANNISCYRVYDRDLPEYAAAIDIYEEWAHIQEYAAPRLIASDVATKRFHDIVMLTAPVLALCPNQIVTKVRKRQREGSQYQRQADRRAYHQVREGGYHFWINLNDYIDTGLFLDQRRTRALLQQLSHGKRFLNLFSYTGAATVYAAKGGALSTTSVDLSATYVDWLRRNLELNGIVGRRHRVERADCLAWLRDCRERYDLIYLDPPTFSRSKRMQGTLDIQRDHQRMITATAHLLEPGGILVFTTNYRRFKLDHRALDGLVSEDLTRSTLPYDFARTPRLRHVWRFTKP